MKIYVKKVEGVTLPKKGSDVAAGYDIIATSEPKIVGEKHNSDGTGTYWKSIDYIEYETNLFIAPTAQTVHTLIHPRSSVSKYNLVLANSIGLVDNDYRGMLLCRFKYVWQPLDLLYVPAPTGADYVSGIIAGKLNMDKIYKKGDAIAQLVGESTLNLDFEFVDDLSQTARGEGGFGSTTKTQEPVTEHKTSTSPLMDIYKSAVPDGGPRLSYEKMVKEREKELS